MDPEPSTTPKRVVGVVIVVIIVVVGSGGGVRTRVSVNSKVLMGLTSNTNPIMVDTNDIFTQQWWIQMTYLPNNGGSE